MPHAPRAHRAIRSYSSLPARKAGAQAAGYPLLSLAVYRADAYAFGWRLAQKPFFKPLLLNEYEGGTRLKKPSTAYVFYAFGALSSLKYDSQLLERRKTSSANSFYSGKRKAE